MSGYGGYEYSAENADTGGGGFANDGGGFLSQGNASQAEKEKKPRDKQSLVPMTIKQFLSATKAGVDGDEWTVDGRAVQQVRVVGNVLKQDKRETKCTYTLEDQTGMVDATMWINAEEEGETTAARAARSAPGNYVVVIGQPKEYGGKLYISAYDVRPVDDFNEVTHHFLEAIYSHAKQTHKMNNPQAAAPVNDSFGAFNASSAAPAGGAAAMDTSGGGGGLGLSPDQTRVFNYYTAEGTGDEGCNITSVADALGMPAAAVRNAVDFLSSEGHLYSTIDDDHHKSTSE
jgi:replication factor A2